MAQSGLNHVISRLRRGVAKPTSDVELLERYRATGETEAFTEIVERHGPRVFAVCRRILGHHHLAEDAYQATFVVFVRKAHTIQSGSALGGFLYAVARKAALRAAIMNRRRKTSPLPDLPTEMAHKIEPDELAMLDEEIANLSDTLRSAVILCELEGLSRADAAKQLGIAEGTLSSRLATARQQLAERLKKRGVVLSAGMFTALAGSATACPPILTIATTTVDAIANGVLKTMMLIKLKLATLGVMLVMMLGVGTLMPKGRMQANAAPVPKAEPDEGHLWFFNDKQNHLTAFTPEGKVAKKLTLDEGVEFLGITPDGMNLLLPGKNGKVVTDTKADGLTLHLRGIHDEKSVADLRIPYQADDVILLLHGGKRLVRLRPTGKPNEHTHTLIDRETREEIKIELPKDHGVARATTAYPWLVVAPSNPAIANGIALQLYSLEDKKLTPIDNAIAFSDWHVTHVGKGLVGLGLNKGKPEEGVRVYTVDFITKKVTASAAVSVDAIQNVIEGGDKLAVGIVPFPKGVRVVLEGSKLSAPGESKLYLVEPDFRNVVEWATIQAENPGDTLPWGWFPSKPRPAAKPKEAENPKQPIAAPVPKAVPDEGLIWVKYSNPDRKVAFTPSGKVVREVKYPALLLSKWKTLSRDHEQILYLAKGGKLTEDEGQTLHIAKFDEHELKIDGATAVDTGMVPQKNEGFQFTRDQKGIVRILLTQVGMSGENRQPMLHRHTYFDIATKKETELKLPEAVQIIDESLDGKEWIGMWYNTGNNKLPGYRYLRLPKNGDNPIPICDDYQFPFFTPSPDYKSYLGLGRQHKKPAADENGLTLYHYDPLVGKAVELHKFKDYEQRSLFWSPDAKQYLVQQYKQADIFAGSITGGNHRKLFTIPNADEHTFVLGWYPTWNAAKQ